MDILISIMKLMDFLLDIEHLFNEELGCFFLLFWAKVHKLQHMKPLLSRFLYIIFGVFIDLLNIFCDLALKNSIFTLEFVVFL